MSLYLLQNLSNFSVFRYCFRTFSSSFWRLPQPFLLNCLDFVFILLFDDTSFVPFFLLDYSNFVFLLSSGLPQRCSSSFLIASNFLCSSLVSSKSLCFSQNVSFCFRNARVNRFVSNCLPYYQYHKESRSTDFTLESHEKTFTSQAEASKYIQAIRLYQIPLYSIYLLSFHPFHYKQSYLRCFVFFFHWSEFAEHIKQQQRLLGKLGGNCS